LVPQILQSLAALDVEVIVATAGKAVPGHVPANAHVADFLPGVDAARRAELVICNGGSPTTQQALAAGTPVIGIASNLDQFLNMEAIQRSGAGEIVRADRFNGSKLTKLTRKMLNTSEYGAAARYMGALSSRYDSADRFVNIVRNVLGGAAFASARLSLQH
jgi:UDP:flavonoid glycosyltransferase YjiC (YdhE family)